MMMRLTLLAGVTLRGRAHHARCRRTCVSSPSTMRPILQYCGDLGRCELYPNHQFCLAGKLRT
jgi:hypothetical protein